MLWQAMFRCVGSRYGCGTPHCASYAVHAYTVVYVPEDQLKLALPRPITHHVIDSGEVFTKYDAGLGRYVPHEILAYRYPADFPWL